MIALRVMRRPGATEPDPTALELPPEGLTIGRADDCGLVLADPLRLVSRQHARVVPAGHGARVRCISSNAPLWVNEAQLDPGADRELLEGDRLRIGRFELAVEAATAVAAQRSRLERWFDLDDAPDPLAVDSPLPAVQPSGEAAATEALASWEASRSVLRADAERTPEEPGELPEAPPPARSQAFPAVPVELAMLTLPSAGDTAPAGGSPAGAADASPQLQVLAEAFARGAGLAAQPAPLTPEWMEHLGALLRASAEGTLALLQSRAITKRHMRAEGTHIAPRQNNPLKFSPDANEALARMLQRDAGHGFLDPVAALHDAHHDLLVHQVAMVAGMRAAVFELFSRLSPEAAEQAEGPPHGISRWPLVRAAALWQRHRNQHAQLLEKLDEDFETIFGREFLRAYEAQSRHKADAPAAAQLSPGPGPR